MRASESLRAVRTRMGVVSMRGSGRTWRTSSSPAISGIMKSHTMTSGRERTGRSTPSLPVVGGGHPVGGAQCIADEVVHVDVVLDDEDQGAVVVVGGPRRLVIRSRRRSALALASLTERAPSCPPARTAVPGGATNGTSTTKSAPPSGASSTPMEPPCSCDQLAGDAEAEPGAAPGRMGLAVESMEAFEHLAPVVRRDARAAVSHLDAGDVATIGARPALAHARQLDPHPTVRRCELERVGQQVEEHLLQAGRVDLRRHGGSAPAPAARRPGRRPASRSCWR